MDVGTLQHEIDRLEQDAKSRLDEARKLSDSAGGYRAMGNNNEADADDSQAAKLSDEADRLRRQAESARSDLQNTIQKIDEIDQKQKDLSSRFENEMNQLDQEKRRLLGGLSSYSTSLF